MRGRGLAVGAVLGAVVASAVGVAYAAIPDSRGVVHACFQNVTSANKPVKLLDTAKTATCPSGWKAVSWNQKGVPGTNGTNGTNGTTIDARLRISAPIQVPLNGGTNASVTVPMTPSSFNQAANEVQAFYGQVDFNSPASCHLSSSGTAAPQVQEKVSIDGRLVSSGDMVGVLGTRTKLPLDFTSSPPYLFEPGSPATHTISVSVGQDCNGTGENITLNGFSIDIAGMR